MPRVSKSISRALHQPQMLLQYVRTYTYGLLWRYKYSNRPYRDFYSEVMRMHVAVDPKTAVGGLWDGIDKLQFDFMRDQGLAPNHKLLDPGCGCLRGGLLFIRYLAKGNYYGVDISPEILEQGREFLSEAGLEAKRPILKINNDSKFNDFEGEHFDFIIAFSVFAHMPLEDVKECFENINKVMKPRSVFFVTFLDGVDKPYIKGGYQDFYYPFETLRRIGANHHYEVDLVEPFVHPKKGKMMRITLKPI